ncbi:ATP-binding protein [Nocardia brasiliensis]|uniref:ATP-binding protein n=1 Tax=Nocardia brasiliensis TaxID=37326 RepID=UPI002456049E|nr:BTAD domain-containing putative transcriptional regulator [Nocardia brasiliensis]
MRPHEYREAFFGGCVDRAYHPGTGISLGGRRKGKRGNGSAGAAAGAAQRMEILVLGPVLVRDGDREIVIDRPLERAALVRLALGRGAVIADATLVADLWGEDGGGRPVERLWSLMSRLRGALGPHAGLVVRSATGYSTTATVTDLTAVTAAAERIAVAQRAGRTAQVRAAAAEALQWWRGAALADLRGVPFADFEADRLERRRLDLVVTRIEAALAADGAAETVLELSRLTGAHPLHELLHRLSALALYRTGRQPEALAVLDRLRGALAEELGVEPEPATIELRDRMLRHDPALRLPAAQEADERRWGSGLPGPDTSFLGRADELAELVGRVADAGLVTLVGAAGSGKSRLALEAARVVARTDRAVVFVELAALPQGARIAPALAAAADMDAVPGAELADLAPGLADALVVLDNAEHLLAEVVSTVDALLAHRVSVLVTSQRALDHPDEQVMPVGALDRRPAVELFAERVDGALAEPDRDPVLRICAAVEWLPLGIELAAGLTRTLTVAQLSDRIDDRVRLLVGGRPDAAGGRHASLRAALDWSYELLDAPARTVLRRSSVFVGGFAPEAIESIVPAAELGGAAVADVLAELARRSLLTVLTDGDYRRYALLETVRDHAAHRLTAAGETAELHRRHAMWCLDHACAVESRDGFSSAASVAAIFAEWPNILAAMTRAPGTAHAETGLRLAITMHQAWNARAWYSEANRHFEALIDTVDARSEHRVRALTCWSFHAIMLGKLDRAAELLAEAAELVDPAAPKQVLQIDYNRGCIDVERGRYRSAIEALQAAEARAEEMHYVQGASASADACGSAQLFAGLAEDALESYRRATEYDRALGDELGLARGLANQARALFDLGRFDEALEVAAEADDYSRRLDDRHMLAFTEQVRGGVELAAGRLDSAESHCRMALSHMGIEVSVADIDLADVLIAQGALSEARTLLERAYGETEPGRTSWFAARAISAALALAEGNRRTARDLVERTLADYARGGFGWRRYVDRLGQVREQLLG